MQAQQVIATILIAFYFCGGLQVEGSITKLPRLPENIQDLKCEADDIGFAFNLTELAGYWYEAMRIPNVQVTECLNVSVPAEINNTNLNLDVTYVSTLNNGWNLTKEVVTFPWSNSTQHGIFELKTGSVSYKLVTTDYVSIAVLCGYGSSSAIPIFKLFTRDREVSQEIYELINTQAEQAGYESLINWEKQSLAECGDSSGQAPLGALMGFNTFFGGLSVWASY
ncbi:hypothetical protein KR084_009565 [Drosophila pseudotakahashii]|nr:hypothetical protein KR084_009565 [Drosophila pseudotakahashii]